MNHSAKMLYYDIESTKSRFIREQYGAKIYDKRFKWQELVRPFSLISAAWKISGDDETHCVSVSSKNPYNDEYVVRKLHSVLSEADILIGHNSDQFDYKKFNARAIYYNLPPIAPKQSIDTLKVAKKHFGFEFNSLGYLASYLGIELKDESPDWDKVMAGCPIELAKTREYNKQDCITGDRLYLRLRAWMNSHPNVSLYTPIKDIEGKKLLSCPKCNSMNYKKNGCIYNQKTKTQRYSCLDCGSYFSGERISL